MIIIDETKESGLRFKMKTICHDPKIKSHDDTCRDKTRQVSLLHKLIQKGE